MDTIPALPPPDTPWVLSKSVLDEASLTGELHLLAPGAERATDYDAPGDIIVFAVAGSVTVRIDLNHHVLQPEKTLRIPAGRRHTLLNTSPAPAKVLLITLPPPPPRFASLPGLVTLRG